MAGSFKPCITVLFVLRARIAYYQKNSVSLALLFRTLLFRPLTPQEKSCLTTTPRNPLP